MGRCVCAAVARWMALLTVLVLLTGTSVAQPAADEPSGGLTAEPLADTAPPTVAESTATRRPRLPTATPSLTATATSTETATSAPPTSTATRPPATATPTLQPTMTATATATQGLAAMLLSRDSGGMPWLALGALLTLAGVWLGARIGGGRDRTARGRARKTQASAMLLELRRIDAVLRRVVALDNPASFPSLEHPIIEAALRDLTLFNAETAARIAQFHGALRGIQHEIGDYRDNPLRWAGRLAELNQLIKGRAAAACRAVPALLKALEKEGGAPPPPLSDPAPAAAQEGGTRLPPPPFGPGEGDDWTM